MSFGQIPIRTLSIALSVALLAALFPLATSAEPGKSREYIVTLSVADSNRTIAPSSKDNKQRIRQRAKSASEATERVTAAHGIEVGHRYGYAVTGFSATMTPAQAAAVAAEPEVVDVRPARTFSIANTEVIPFGIKRVKAWTDGTLPGPDVDADVAVLDTGIGPASYDGTPIPGTQLGTVELNIKGGTNCFGTSQDPVVQARWGDTLGHGTHVAGTIGARDNTIGTIGVAPGVGLWSVRVFQGSEGSETAVVCGLDWAIATYSNDTPDIDVINMSMQGPRLDYLEDCGVIQSSPTSDPIQRSICTATQIGITVVASAGNSSINANESSPGGFDQVISVGAINDTDGDGGGVGPTTSCSSYPGQRDDVYASYSNHGVDVDIVAPGTCVASTSYADPSGDSEVVMSGTSMAAPHVTGAVARYLAANPGTPPGRMRDLVRVAGRLDWDIKTDPVWMGVNDPDAPNRVLDVATLVGAPLVRTWLSHDSFKIGGTQSPRATRVDVQRGGSYEGPVNLGVIGLPGSASARFDRGTLNGLTELGTNLYFGTAGGGADGVFGLAVRSEAGGLAPHDRAFTLTVDRTGPAVGGLSTRFRGGKAPLTRKGGAQAYVQWLAPTDALSGVGSTQLQRKIGAAAWRNAGTPGANLARVTLKPGQLNRFRVRATDSLGNVSFSGMLGARMTIRDSKSTAWKKPAGGTWKTKKVKKAFGGSILLARGATPSLRTTFRGKSVALVGSVGPSRGTFRVRVDGGPWKMVNLRNKKAGHRKVVWIQRLVQGTHTLEVQGRTGQTAIDAFLVVA